MLLNGSERKLVDENAASDPNLQQQNASALEGIAHRKRKLTAYERATGELITDERVRQEINCGRRIGLYQIRGSIGAGNFSQVKLAVHVLTGEQVAMKILDKTRLDAKTQRLLSREISSMERLHHPNVIRLYEVVETLHKLHIVMEYAAGGELYTKLNTQGKFPEPKAKFIFAQIVSALDHLHTCGVIHRDLKAENIFFAASSTNAHATLMNMSNELNLSDAQSTRQLHVKLGDFGFSTLAKPDEQLTTFCGSPPYAAPELYKDDWYYGPAVDLWAAGVLLYFIMTGMMPFRADTVARLKRLILAGNYILPGWLSADAKLLIKQLMNPIPTQRISIAAIRSHPWLRGEVFPMPLQPYPKTLNAFLLSSKGNSNIINNNNNNSSSNTDQPSLQKEHIPIPNRNIYLPVPVVDENSFSNESSNVATPVSLKCVDYSRLNSADCNSISQETSPTTRVFSPSVAPVDDPHREVKQLLAELGITEEHLRRDANADARSNITGTYRIVLHRVHKSRRMSNIPSRLTHANSDSQLSTMTQNPDMSRLNRNNHKGRQNKMTSQTVTLPEHDSTAESASKYSQSRMCLIL